MLSFTKLKKVVAVFCCCVLLSLNFAFASEISREPPVDAPYKGGYWITGIDSNLGEVDIYTPNGTGWCYDASGNLFRYSSSAGSGVLFTENGTKYTFNAPAFSVPRYRLASSSGWDDYTDLDIDITSTNIIIQSEFETPYSLETMSYIVIVFLCGMLVVVNLVKGR